MWPFEGMSLSSATRWGDVANLTLLACLIGGVVATFVIVRTSNVKEHHWDEERRQSAERISLNEAETKRAIADSDVAKLQTEALRKSMAPRIFSFDGSGMRDSLKGIAKAPIEILYDKEASDASTLALMVFGVFKSEGWVVAFPESIPEGKHSDPMVQRISPKYFWVGLQAWGLGVVTNPSTPLPESVRDMAIAMSRAIPGQQVSSGTNEYAPAGVIRILIGPRP